MTPQAALAELGTVQRDATGWFDGFWDFFVPNRALLETVPVRSVSGYPPPWLAVYWEPPDGPRLDIFVEAKDRRPGSRAPAPVITLGPPRDPLPDRPIAAIAGAHACAFGYWGLHARCELGRSLVPIVDELVAIARAYSDAV